jgi:hypothetical protein
MPFANFDSIGAVARAYLITVRDDKFVTPLERPVSDSLRGDLAFVDEHGPTTNSEAARCESLIFPVLKEVWKSYVDDLTFWSHEPLYFDAELSGIPDYFVARRSPLGRWVMEPPYLVVVEAKRDDFEAGWGQCLAALLAAQKLNNLPELTLHGITTNGKGWEFGKLESDGFTRDPRLFTLADLETLCGALHFVFEQCCVQVRRLPRSA